MDKGTYIQLDRIEEKLDIILEALSEEDEVEDSNIQIKEKQKE